MSEKRATAPFPTNSKMFSLARDVVIAMDKLASAAGMDARGAGRSQRLVSEAPEGATYVVHDYSALPYFRAMAQELNRGDIDFVSFAAFTGGRAYAGKRTYVVFDHHTWMKFMEGRSAWKLVGEVMESLYAADRIPDEHPGGGGLTAAAKSS